jgi:hypothetical protein
MLGKYWVEKLTTPKLRYSNFYARVSEALFHAYKEDYLRGNYRGPYDLIRANIHCFAKFACWSKPKDDDGWT